MSTFSGLSAAQSALNAQRQAIEVAGQNLANANTVGYTRQRTNMTAVSASQVAAIFSTSNGIGGGVTVSSIARLNDEFLTARVRASSSDSGYLTARSNAYSALETSISDTGSSGLTQQLSVFWQQWSDVASSSDKSSSATVLLKDANSLVDTMHTMYSSISTQWNDTHAQAQSLVAQVNSTAANVAQLNQTILGLTSTGQSPSELEDQRDQLITTLSSLVGATASTNADGTIDVMVGGSALVSGKTANAVSLTGATGLAEAGTTPVQLSWASSGGSITAGGQIGGLVSVLTSPEPDGSGGVLTEAAKSLDRVATMLATKVNALHTTAYTTSGAQGGSFFTLPTSGSAAAGISVAITNSSDVAVSAWNSQSGAYDGSVGQQIAALAKAADGPAAAWGATITALGSATSSAASRASVATTSLGALQTSLTAETSVDSDEETVNLIAYQRAYQASAKVISVVDEILQTVIGMVGS